MEKLTAKEEEIQQAKKKGQENYDKLVATQDREEMGKELEMMVNAYQTLQKSSAASASKQEELDKAKTRIAELEEQVNAIDLDAINKAHEDKIKKLESESKGALDGAKARREAEVQSYKDKITKLTAEQEELKKKLEEKEKQEDFLKNEKRELKAREQEIQQRLESTKKELNTQRLRATEAEVSLTGIRDKANGYENNIRELTVQLECEKKNIADLQNQLKSANEKVENAENDHSETRKKLDDKSMEHKIAAKHQVRMIKD